MINYTIFPCLSLKSPRETRVLTHGFTLERCVVFLACSNAHDTFDIRNEDLAIAHFPGACRGNDHIHDRIDLGIIGDDLELDLRNHVQDDLVTTEILAPSMLVAATMHLRDGHT